MPNIEPIAIDMPVNAAKLTLVAEQHSASHRPGPIPLARFTAEMRHGFSGEAFVDAGRGAVIPVEATAGDPSRLLVLFHGAVDRSVRPVPFYQRNFALTYTGPVATLSIADPSLERSDRLFIAGYAGHEGADVGGSVTAVLQSAISALEPERVILFGGSSGSYAALQQALAIPDSVVVLQNPLVDLMKLHPPLLEEYKRACWPSLKSAKELPKAVRTNIADLYGGKLRTNVICLQNPTDHHANRQAYMLGAAIEDFRRFLLVAEFDASMIGHKAAVDRMARWVGAALRAPDTDVYSIAALAAEIEPYQQVGTASDYEYAARLAAL